MACGCKGGGSRTGTATRGAGSNQVRPTLVRKGQPDRQYATVGEAEEARKTLGGSIVWKPPQSQ